MSLAAYHHELDILREDWALEMFGRWHLLKIRNRRHNACTHGVALLTGLKQAVLGEKMQRETFAILGTKGSDGTDLVGPDSWRGLRRRYERRKSQIEEKYAGLLGMRPVWGSHAWKL